jgi:LuxR family transcriptional regulator, maltose regulon positive regulatory protein
MGGRGTQAPVPQIQLRPPPLRQGVVGRTKLTDRLKASPELRTVTIVAPPGYGKTTLLSLWKGHETRPTGWLTVDRYDNDPAILYANIVAALQHAGMLSPGRTGDVRVPSDLVVSYGMAQLANVLDAQGAAGVLMLDHVEAVESRAANDAIAELAVRLPRSIQLVLASRTDLRLPIALLRAQGALLEIHAPDLAMDTFEARELLANVGVDVGDELDELVDHTEGWPAGLYLVASAIKAGVSPHAAVRIGGNDRFLADYLREQVLDRVSEEQLWFLLRTSILERFCGPLCDAVLDATSSARTIEELEASNRLVVPLDRTRDWYRYHHLLQEFLQAELVRRERGAVAGLHSKAAEWLDANEMPEEAITHAQAADDADRAARIVGRIARRTYALGREDTALGWLRWFERTGHIGRHPEISSLGAWACAMSGDEVGTDRWADALLASDEVTTSGRLLQALLARHGIDQMRADAQAAKQSAPGGSEWQAAAFALEGLAELSADDNASADLLFARAASMGERLVALPTAVFALAERAVIAVGRGDWDNASRYSDESANKIRERGLERYITSGLGFAVGVRCLVHRGDIAGAHRLLVQAVAIRPRLTTATPAISVQTLLEIAKAHLALSDVTGARTVIRQSASILTERPKLGILLKQHGEIKARLDTMAGGIVGPTALTAAELRLLPLLMTHFSFPEIGERLYLSRHTVKTQAMSIYRKLGVSSRSEAVRRATDSGLLTP